MSFIFHIDNPQMVQHPKMTSPKPSESSCDHASSDLQAIEGWISELKATVRTISNEKKFTEPIINNIEQLYRSLEEMQNYISIIKAGAKAFKSEEISKNTIYE